MVIYEMHVKGFTMRANFGVSPDRRGTYAGVIEKIPYLKELGVTVVELLPAHQRDRLSHQLFVNLHSDAVVAPTAVR